MKKLKLLDKLTFGKYKGKIINDVIKRDVQYINWAIGKKIFRLRFIANITYKLSYRKWNKEMRDILLFIHRCKNDPELQEFQAQSFHEDCGDR